VFTFWWCGVASVLDTNCWRSERSSLMRSGRLTPRVGVTRRFKGFVACVVGAKRGKKLRIIVRIDDGTDACDCRLSDRLVEEVGRWWRRAQARRVQVPVVRCLDPRMS
jgi:hypothetical protein